MSRKVSTKDSTRALALAVGSILAAWAGPAAAADWSYDPKVTGAYLYDDNLRLTDVPGQEISVSGAELDALLGIRANTPRTEFLFAPRVRATFFPGDEDQESDNWYLRSFLRNKGERYSTGIDARYSSVETRGRYFPDSAVADDDVLGQPGTVGGVGQSTDTNREDKIEVVPDITFELAERHGLALRARYLDVTYDIEVPGDKEDYTSISAATAYQFKYSPKSTAELEISGARFEQDGLPDVDSSAASVEWRTRLSETSEYYLRGGANRVESDDGWETGVLLGAGVRWSYEVTDLFLDLNRDLNPDSTGDIVERAQLRFQVRRELTPTMRLDVAARVIRDSSPDDNSNFDDRDYATGSIGLGWRFTRQFSLGGQYTYVWREYDSKPDAAESNRFTLGVTYEPNRR